ncbi:MAG: tetratricopeptide repeat protein [Candidatus Fermentibacteraceae bacterium]|nr:tetratricopeptide repeat protein [Candidatus Fermentibacteraceae bacterium]
MSSEGAARGRLVPGERREVAVLFIDLHGFTALSEELDHETVHRLTGGIMRALSRTIEAHGGYLDKYEGDRIMALFGAVRTHLDDCERAVSAGLRMLEIVMEIQSILSRRKISIGARVGISYGPVTVAPDPSGHLTASGDLVNIASRMESSAGIGTVQVTEGVRDECGDIFTWLDLGERDIRGRRMPVHSYRPIGHGSDRILRKKRVSSLEWEFVNREAELEGLGSALRDFAGSDSRASRLFILRGFDGAGKTRLAGEFASGILSSGLTGVLLSDTSPYAQKPFQMWTDALGRLKNPAERLLTGEDERACLLELLGEGDWEGADRLSPHDLMEMRRSVISRAVLSIQGNSPLGVLLIVADNLHRADSASLEILNGLLEMPGFFIVACVAPGSEEQELRGSLGEEHASSLTVIDIPPLSEDATAQLVRSVLRSAGRFPDNPDGRILLRGIFTKSSGLPFIAVEMLRLLIESGFLALHGDRWELESGDWEETVPESVRGLLRCRIDSLSRSERKTLQIASITGRRFDVRVLRGVAGQLDPVLSGEVDSCVAAMAGEGILESVSGQGGDVFEFSSPVFQEIASSTVLRQNRMTVHRATAEELERIFGSSPGRFSAEIALHLQAAGDTLRAVSSGFKALEYLAGTYQNEECLSFSRLMEGWVAGSDQPERGDILMEILIRRQNVQYRTGRLDDMEKTLIRQLELALQRGGDVELGKTYCSYGELKRMRRDSPAAREYLDRAIECSRRGGDLNVLGMSLSNMGALLHGLGESEGAVRCFKEAISVQEQCGNSRSAAIAMLNLSAMHIDADRVDLGLELLEKALGNFRKVSYKTGEASALLNMGLLLEKEGRPEKAPGILREAVTLSRETGFRHGLANSLAVLGRILADTDPVEAEECLLESMGLCEEISEPGIKLEALVSLSRICLEDGRLDDACSMYVEALALCREKEGRRCDDNLKKLKEIRSDLSGRGVPTTRLDGG